VWNVAGTTNGAVVTTHLNMPVMRGMSRDPRRSSHKNVVDKETDNLVTDDMSLISPAARITLHKST